MTESATVVFVSTPFPTLSIPFEMAGRQLYDMMHSLLQSIAAGTVSGSPGNGGPNTDHALCTVFRDALRWPPELRQPDVLDALRWLS